MPSGSMGQGYSASVFNWSNEGYLFDALRNGLTHSTTQPNNFVDNTIVSPIGRWKIDDSKISVLQGDDWFAYRIRPLTRSTVQYGTVVPEVRTNRVFCNAEGLVGVRPLIVVTEVELVVARFDAGWLLTTGVVLITLIGLVTLTALVPRILRTLNVESSVSEKDVSHGHFVPHILQA